MASENTVPVNEEENEKDAVRDESNTDLGNPHDIENKEAGEFEAVQHAYDASAPSDELNLDAGIESEKQNEGGEEDYGSERVQIVYGGPTKLRCAQSSGDRHCDDGGDLQEARQQRDEQSVLLQ